MAGKNSKSKPSVLGSLGINTQTKTALGGGIIKPARQTKKEEEGGKKNVDTPKTRASGKLKKSPETKTKTETRVETGAEVEAEADTRVETKPETEIKTEAQTETNVKTETETNTEENTDTSANTDENAGTNKTINNTVHHEEIDPIQEDREHNTNTTNIPQEQNSTILEHNVEHNNLYHQRESGIIIPHNTNPTADEIHKIEQELQSTQNETETYELDKIVIPDTIDEPLDLDATKIRKYNHKYDPYFFTKILDKSDFGEYLPDDEIGILEIEHGRCKTLPLPAPLSSYSWHDNVNRSFRDEGEEVFANIVSLDAALSLAILVGASDTHIDSGQRIGYSIEGKFVRTWCFPIIPQSVMRMLYKDAITHENTDDFVQNKDLDTSYTITQGPFRGERFRLNISEDHHGEAMVFRTIPSSIPTPQELNIPQQILDWMNYRHGLILVNGATGSGKTTTLASMINNLIKHEPITVCTAELPIEFIYDNSAQHALGRVKQREVEKNTKTFSSALKAMLRRNPDIILVGEVRAFDEIEHLLNASQTGHLALSTIHAFSSPQVLSRVIAMTPIERREEVLNILGQSLRGSVNQILLPKVGGGRVAVREILENNAETRKIIERGDTRELRVLQQDNGQTMEHEVVKVFEEGLIERETLEHLTYDMPYIKQIMS